MRQETGGFSSLVKSLKCFPNLFFLPSLEFLKMVPLVPALVLNLSINCKDK